MRRTFEYYSVVLLGSAAVFMVFHVLLTPLPTTSMATVAAMQSQYISRPRPIVMPRSGIPTRMVIAALGIDIPVRVGEFDSSTGLWTVSDDAVFYANTSVPTNDTNGRTLIYGHAKWGIFGALPDLQRNTEVEIYTDTGYQFRYKYTSMREVVPTDISVFTQQGAPELVLQTCSGPWDEHRALYTFSFVEGKKL